MEKDLEDKVRAEFAEIVEAAYNALEKIDGGDIDFNPFLLRIMGFETPRDAGQTLVRNRRRGYGGTPYV